MFVLRFQLLYLFFLFVTCGLSDPTFVLVNLLLLLWFILRMEWTKKSWIIIGLQKRELVVFVQNLMHCYTLSSYTYIGKLYLL